MHQVAARIAARADEDAGLQDALVPDALERPLLSCSSTLARVCQIWPITASPVRMNCSDSAPLVQKTVLRRISRTFAREARISSG